MKPYLAVIEREPWADRVVALAARSVDNRHGVVVVTDTDVHFVHRSRFRAVSLLIPLAELRAVVRHGPSTTGRVHGGRSRSTWVHVSSEASDEAARPRHRDPQSLNSPQDRPEGR